MTRPHIHVPAETFHTLDSCSMTDEHKPLSELHLRLALAAERCRQARAQSQFDESALSVIERRIREILERITAVPGVH